MRLTNPDATLFIPDETPEEEALARTTHMGIGAHQDDLEIMAFDGILRCFGRDDLWFTGVTVTNGAGSPRDDLYADYTDEQMQVVRAKEQLKAAVIGEYSAQFLLGYSSSQVKDPSQPACVDDISRIVTAAKPRIIYAHNLADKHDTHVAIGLRVIEALRRLPEEARPERLFGCEVWRDLDWMNDDDKVMFDVAAHENLAASLVSVFDSQICGGKRYDLATIGRRRANATYAASHGTDDTTLAIYAMELTPLIRDISLDVADYVRGYLMAFRDEVLGRVERLG